MNDYYYVWLERGQYIFAQYTNLGGTGLFGSANVELVLYAPDQTPLDDTYGTPRTYVDGFAQTTGKHYLRVYRDTQDGFYNLSYQIRNGTPNLDRQTSIEVFDNSTVDSWLVITPYATMEHWYKIDVAVGEKIRVDMTGNIEMWLYAELTQVDTTDFSLDTYVSHVATGNNWYYLRARPDADTDFSVFFTIQDSPKPTSSLSTTGSYWKTTSVTITASTSSVNVDYIELWYRFSSNNGTWGTWVNFGADATSPYSWVYNFPSGQGYYEFYSRAMNIYTKYEDAPSNADIRCGFDSIAPSSNVNSIVPYIQTSTTIQVNATASDATSGITNIVMYYRYSIDNSSWNSWAVSSTDYSMPWSWSFSWPNSEGYYQFYCVASDRSGNIEPNPVLNDSRCFYNNIPAPVILNWPSAPSTDGTQIDLSWSQYTDSDFASYNIYYGTSPGSTTYIGKFTLVSTTSCMITSLTPQTQYYFVVRVNDTSALYADSNEVYSRTFTTSDTGDDFASARTVNPFEAWSEDITALLDSRDYYKIWLNAGETLWANMTGNAAGDPDLYLYNTSQAVIKSSISAGATESVSATADLPGYYYVRVEVGLIGTNWNTVWFEVS